MSIPATRVIRVLDELVAVHGRPASVGVDDGPELLAQVFVDWCAARRILVRCIQAGKLEQNAYIERFNRGDRGFSSDENVLFAAAWTCGPSSSPISSGLSSSG